MTLGLAPLSMGLSRQEYWNRLPLPSPGDLPDPAIKSRCPTYRETLYHLSHQRSPGNFLDNIKGTIQIGKGVR